MSADIFCVISPFTVLSASIRMKIVVAARDSQGAKSKIGKTILDIQVDDVNDNAPDLYANIIVKSRNQTGERKERWLF